MFRMIRAELFKLYKNKTFRVLCIIALVISILIIVATTEFVANMIAEEMKAFSPEQQAAMLKQATPQEIVPSGNIGFGMTMYSTPVDVFYASFGSGFIEILIGVLVGGFLAKEYSEGTMKNILAYGKSRISFYLTKFFTLVIAIAIITLILVGVSTIGVTILHGWDGFQIADLGKMLFSFLASVVASSAVAAICMIISVLVKSNGATIGIIVMAFVIIPSLILAIYGIYPSFDAIYELTPYYNNVVATSQIAEANDLIKSMFISLVTILGSLAIGITIFKKQDIK